MDEIVLHPAFSWDCPACGKRGIFVAAVEAELTDDERGALRRKFGMDDEGEAWKQAGEDDPFVEGCGLVTSPDTVICPDCRETFKVFTDPEVRMPPGFNPHTDLI